MRKMLVAAVTGLFVLAVLAPIGCDSKSVKTPDKVIDTPKEGPKAAGGGGGGAGAANKSQTVD